MVQEIILTFERRLAGFPTTEAEDEELLANKKDELHWTDRRVIEFRQERKRALRLTIERLKEREKSAYSLLSGSSYVDSGKDEL